MTGFRTPSSWLRWFRGLSWRQQICLWLGVFTVAGLGGGGLAAAIGRNAAVSVSGRSESIDVQWHANENLRSTAAGLVACAAPQPSDSDRVNLLSIASPPECRTASAYRIPADEESFLEIGDGVYLTIERVGLGGLVIQGRQGLPVSRSPCRASGIPAPGKGDETWHFRLVSSNGALLASWPRRTRFVLPDAVGMRRDGKPVLMPVSGYLRLGDDVRSGVSGLLLDGRAAIREPSLDRILLPALIGSASYAATEQDLMRGDRVTITDGDSCATQASGVILVDKDDEPGFAFAVHGGPAGRSVHVDRLGQQEGTGFDIDVSWTDRVTGDAALSAVLAISGLLAGAFLGALLSIWLAGTPAEKPEP